MRLAPVAFALALLTAVLSPEVPRASAPQAWTITGARLADGTGAPLRQASVRIDGDTIVAVGDLTAAPDDRVVDAKGLVLAPGFIDPHNHSTSGLDTSPDAATQVSQGITTLLVGQDGSSPWPIAEYLARRRAQ